MNALSIDCSVSKISIAAKKDNKLVKVTLDVGIKQSEKLLPAIDYVMAEAELKANDLDYSAVTIGPGTFTGLRLGLSALKAINLAYNVPVYGIPSLEAYQWPYRKLTASLKTIVLPLLEEKEDEYFYAHYESGKLLTEITSAPYEEIIKSFDPEITVLTCGPGALHFTESVNENFPLYKINCFAPENDCCESLFQIAENMIETKQPPLQDYDGPLYFRKSEAELVYEKNHPESKENN